jgi:hypothetical protein
MTDQNRKTLRSFYCRDYLWELFEQMTHELGCSMDYLINESMRMYARSREFPQGAEPGAGPQGAFNPSGPTPMVGPGAAGNSFGQPRSPMAPQGQAPTDRFNYGGGGPADHRTFDRMPSVGPTAPRPPQAPMQPPQAPMQPPQAPMGGGGYGMPPQAPMQPPQAPMQPPQAPMPPRAPMQPQAPQQPMGLAAGPPPPPPRPSGNWPATGGQPQAPGFGQPPAPTGGFGAVGAPAGRAPLYLTFNNNKYLVDKDKFIIGRGSQQTDLTIRDGNISRKHCCVIWHNGAYYIKDLESTNGIEFQGNRIESKKVDEGDIFYLCDYELRFSYRG